MGLLGDIGNIGGNIVGDITAPFGGTGVTSPASVISSNDPSLIPDALTGGAVSNAAAVTATNAQNIAYAQQQEQFQERMSDTAYQRAVADMQAAGLNKQLAYSQGPASVPTGTSPDLQAPRPGDVGAGLFSSAKSLISGSADLAQTQSQTALNNHNSALAEANADRASAGAQEAYQNIEKSKQEVAESRQRVKESAQRVSESKSRTRNTDVDTALSDQKRQQSTMDTALRAQRFGKDMNLQNFDALSERVPVVGGLISGARSAARYFSDSVPSENERLRRAGASGIPTSGYSRGGF